MSTKAIAKINERLNAHKEWLERNQFFRRNAIQEAENAAKDPMLYALLFLSESLRSIGLFYGSKGLASSYEGQFEWSDLTGAIEAYLWSARLRFRFYYHLFAPERPVRRSWFLHNLPLAFCLFCHFISVGDEQREQELWSLLQMPLEDRDPRVVEWWQWRRFEPFFALLYCKATGQAAPFDASTCDLGIYRPILEKWEDAFALGKQCAVACDYHLKHMENTRGWDAEFDLPPFDLVPVEIKAIRALRERSQLPPVQIEHPLLQFVGTFETASPPEELLDIFCLGSDKYNEFA